MLKNNKFILLLFFAILFINKGFSQFNYNASIACDFIDEETQVSIIAVYSSDRKGNILNTKYYDKNLSDYNPSGTVSYGSCEASLSGASIDTFYLDNGFYYIVNGTDTLSAPLSINFGNVLYVSPSGNEATALKGDVNKPWSRIDSAYSNSSNGDVIYLLRDTFNVNYSVSAQTGKNIFVFAESGTYINLSSTSLFNLSGFGAFTGSYSLSLIGDVEIKIASSLIFSNFPGTLFLNVDGLSIRGNLSSGTYSGGNLATFIGGTVLNSSIRIRNIFDYGSIGATSLDSSSISIVVENADITPENGVINSYDQSIFRFSGLTNSSVNVKVNNLKYRPAYTSIGFGINNGFMQFSGNFSNSVIGVQIQNLDCDISTISAYSNQAGMISFDAGYSNTEINIDVNGRIKNACLFDDILLNGSSSNASININSNLYVSGNYVINSKENETDLCSDCFVNLIGVYKSDSTLFDLRHNGNQNYLFSGSFRSLSDYSSVFYLNTNIPISIENSSFSTANNITSVSGASGSVFIGGGFSSTGIPFSENITVSYPKSFSNNIRDTINIDDANRTITEREINNYNQIDIVASCSGSASSDVTVTLPNPSSTYRDKIINLTAIDGSGSFGVNLTTVSGTSIISGGSSTATLSLSTDLYRVECRENISNGTYFWFVK